jgi:Domain of unknown function (DUF3458).
MQPSPILLIWALIGWDGWIGEERLLVQDQAELTLMVEGLPVAEPPPALSLFRQFSAPVHWQAHQGDDALFTLSPTTTMHR